MEITSGALNRRIAIQTESTVQDSLGQQLSLWTTGYTCWASIDIQSSQLLYSTAEFMEKVAYRITVRYTSSFVFSPKQRITYSDIATGITRVFNIESVLNTKQGNRELVLMAYELSGTA